MDQVKVDDRLMEIFQTVFEDEELRVTASTTAADVEGWDSVAHITLIFAIEEEFGFQFSSSELESVRNVGDLQALVSQRAR
ncbi:acyl carrier protein [Roseovarius sp.]|uniref:acyl carrier protein n=1 Tax=Roseovarius sp. TaxID=1486281 RepID=UPI003566DBF3